MKSKRRKRRRQSFGPKRLENWARKQLERRQKNGELTIIADNDEAVRKELELRGRAPDFLVRFPDGQYGIYEAKMQKISEAVKQLQAAKNSEKARSRGVKELGIFCLKPKFTRGEQPEIDEEGHRIVYVDNLKIYIYEAWRER